MAIIAAVLLGTFNFGFGAELTFNQCLAVSMYAVAAGHYQGADCHPALLLDGGEGFTFQNPVASNLGGLVDPSSHFLYSVAISLDVFTIWTLVLTGIGYSCLTKVKRGTCMASSLAGGFVILRWAGGFAAVLLDPVRHFCEGAQLRLHFC